MLQFSENGKTEKKPTTIPAYGVSAALKLTTIKKLTEFVYKFFAIA